MFRTRCECSKGGIMNVVTDMLMRNDTDASIKTDFYGFDYIQIGNGDVTVMLYPEKAELLERYGRETDYTVCRDANFAQEYEQIRSELEA